MSIDRLARTGGCRAPRSPRSWRPRCCSPPPLTRKRSPGSAGSSPSGRWAWSAARSAPARPSPPARRAPSLDSSRHTIIYLPNPAVGARGIYTQIVTALGAHPAVLPRDADPAGDRCCSPPRRPSAARPGRARPRRERTCCQLEQLEELRMLTNSEMDSRATFACLLLGQPTLRRKLRQGDVRRAGSADRAAVHDRRDGPQGDRRIHRPPRQARRPLRHAVLR